MSNFIDSQWFSLLGSLLTFLGWFAIWAPVVAMLEYATHRWIMHKANHLLDPHLTTLLSHGRHHKGVDDLEYIDMPVRNGLLLTSPFLAGVLAWGLMIGPLASAAIPAAALLSWSLFYAYLWNRMHRGIHDLEQNWFTRSGPVYRFYLQHHLNHHVNPKSNYGTVFPWTDYLFYSSFERLAARPHRHVPATHAQHHVPVPHVVLETCPATSAVPCSFDSP